MKEFSLNLKNGNVCIFVVRDCLSVISDSKNADNESKCYDAHKFGQSVVFTGSKKNCLEKMNKLKKYVKFKNKHPKASEYLVVLNKLMTIEETISDSKEIGIFTDAMNKQKEALVTYIKTLGVRSFKVDAEGEFDEINDEFHLDFSSKDFLKDLSSESKYSVKEIQKRLVELNKSGVLACFSNMDEIIINSYKLSKK